MSEILEHIDDYFSGRLSPAEKQAFENQCESDPLFAQEVAFVISARDEIKQELYARKTQFFAELYSEMTIKKPTANSVIRRFAPYLAAAGLILIFALFQLFKPTSPKMLAGQFIDGNLASIESEMGDADSLQMGINAYNKKEFKKAELIFKPLIIKSTVRDQALLNLGKVYLVTDRFSEALEQFKKLAEMPELYRNDGLFYQALVLMRRDSKGDRAAAKKILEEVIRKDLPGNKEAKAWIQKF